MKTMTAAEQNKNVVFLRSDWTCGINTGASELTIASSSMINNDFSISFEINEDLWCYCKYSEDYDIMIACEAKGCKI